MTFLNAVYLVVGIVAGIYIVDPAIQFIKDIIKEENND